MMRNSMRVRRFLRGLLWYGQRVVNWLRDRFLYARYARTLNRQLFADVNELDQSELSANRQKLREFCVARGYDQDTQDRWDTHIYRLILTEKWLKEALSEMPSDAKILDLGVESAAEDYWRYKFPRVEWENTDYDLRFPWKVAQASYNMILCTELVEHLSDQPNQQSFNEGFYKLGFIGLLSEAYKALKPGGLLFITTPNAASVLHLKAVLAGTPPWFFINLSLEMAKTAHYCADVIRTLKIEKQ